VDWTWFVTGNAVPALLCAGFVASYGLPGAPRALVAVRRERAAYAAGALVLALALVASWAAVQPVRSQNAEAAAFDRLDQGQVAQAAAIAQIAHRRDPLAINPLFDIASIDTARGDIAGARRALERAIQLEPATAETWRRLGAFRLNVLHQPRSALRAYQTALYLDRSLRSISDVVAASRAVNAAG
jgi:tetratricopeptide (TPR) repeat protein